MSGWRPTDEGGALGRALRQGSDVAPLAGSGSNMEVVWGRGALFTLLFLFGCSLFVGERPMSPTSTLFHVYI
jgi:hypothetical protein